MQAAPIFEPVTHEATREKLCAAIRGAILSGDLQPGQRLKELDLVRQFQVSRPVVREAIQQLAYEGLLLVNMHRGAQVVDLTRDQVDEILSMRLLLETEAVKLARSRITPDDASALQARAQELERARGDDVAFIRLDMAFHESLWRLSGNETLRRHLVLLTSPLFSLGIIMRNRRLLERGGVAARPAGDHIALARRLCGDSLEDALAAIREHITENSMQTRAGIDILHGNSSSRDRLRKGNRTSGQAPTGI